MCGITGVFPYGRTSSALSSAVLDRMVGRLAHRGPDQAGSHLGKGGRIGLGFRRLAIVDLSEAGHQPMRNSDGSVWLVFNGEIYNHAEHRQRFEAQGHSFRGRSDTETLLALYEEYGLDCLNRLRGMFAFAIWDDKRDRLFLARDQLGVKPLYYWLGDGELVFASEIKSILAYPPVSADVDVDALSHYLTFLTTPPPATLFSGISKLAAGHYLTVDRGGPGNQVRYWDAIVPTDRTGRSEQELAAEVRSRLGESVESMLMSDVPYGVFLSGGVDSSANVALMAEHSATPVNTFSVGFKRYDEYNELEAARRIANQFGANHHEVIIDDRDALDSLPDLVRAQDEPLADWVCVPLYFVARLARESKVPVVHIGEGADELFCGYPSYLRRLRLERWWPVLRHLPPSLWTTSLRFAGGLAQRGIGRAQRLTRLLGYVAAEDGTYWGNAIAYRGTAKSRLLGGKYWSDNAPASSRAVVDSLYASLTVNGADYDGLQRISYIELKQRLPELLLMRVDKLTMANSVEARVPFLDQRLVEFAMSLPEHARVQGHTPKALLKRSLASTLPADVLSRPKQGFGAPVREWFRNELKEDLRQTLFASAIHERGYFDQDVIRELFEAHVSGSRDLSSQLWTLYNLFLWYDEWIA